MAVEEPQPLRWLLFLCMSGCVDIPEAKSAFMPEETALVHLSLRGSTSQRRGCAEWLRHVSLEERQQKKMADHLFGCTSKQTDLSICSGGQKQTGPTQAGLGPSFEFKVTFHLDFRLHPLCMLVWKRTASGFEGMNSIIPITSP